MVQEAVVVLGLRQFHEVSMRQAHTVRV